MHKICKGLEYYCQKHFILKQATLQLGHYWRTQFDNTGKIGKKLNNNNKYKSYSKSLK